MQVYITSAYPFHPKDNFAASWLKESAAMNSDGKHSVTEYSDRADVILFAEHHSNEDPYFFQVLNNDLYKKYPHKSILYNDVDKPISLIPSILPSIEKKYYKNDFTRSGPYIARHCENESVSAIKGKFNKEFLFSFIGAARTHPIRKEILLLESAAGFLKDTSDKNLWELTPESKKEYEKEYVDISSRSYFVLCPRGEGVNSYRLYETMQMGLTPVIISDDWVPMQGPNWDKFSIRIAEKDVTQIPNILKERQDEAAKMGELARRNWERWFSKEAGFQVIASMCEELINANNRKKKRIVYSYGQFFRPFHFRNLLRFYKNSLI